MKFVDIETAKENLSKRCLVWGFDNEEQTETLKGLLEISKYILETDTLKTAYKVKVFGWIKSCMNEVNPKFLTSKKGIDFLGKFKTLYTPRNLENTKILVVKQNEKTEIQFKNFVSFVLETILKFEYLPTYQKGVFLQFLCGRRAVETFFCGSFMAMKENELHKGNKSNVTINVCSVLFSGQAKKGEGESTYEIPVFFTTASKFIDMFNMFRSEVQTYATSNERWERSHLASANKAMYTLISGTSLINGLEDKHTKSFDTHLARRVYCELLKEFIFSEGEENFITETRIDTFRNLLGTFLGHSELAEGGSTKHYEQYYFKY